MERPRARVHGVDEHVEPLTRRDHEGVGQVGLVEREPILRHDLEVVPSRCIGCNIEPSFARWISTQSPRFAMSGTVAGNDFPFKR